ncbi:MAG: polysaccharide biosynthesis/export family protein [Desulfobacteraceae bacterium]|jgi:polysaccharide export outer membrane protein
MIKKDQYFGMAVIALFILFFMASTASAANEYKIGPGDILEITVWNDEQLSRQVVVPPDCMVSYPLAGDFYVKGMTVALLEEKIQEQLNKYLPDTPVSVSLLAANDLKIYITGKVNKPGMYPVNLETSVMQALAMAGGLSIFADAKDIIILRRQGDGTIKLNFNYNEIEQGENLGQDILLKRGDVIVVP